MTRSDVIAAVVRVLGRRESTQIFGDHTEIGGLVADELGLAHDPLDALGTGVFVRRLKDWPIELVSKLDWVCVAVIMGDRKAVNRDEEWYARARAAGVTITTFDWLPTPANWHRGLADAIAFSADVGALTYVIDAEKEWRNEADEARRYLAAASKMVETITPRVRLGFTSFSLPTVHGTIPWNTFLEAADVAITQAYDRYADAPKGYAERAIAEYRARGARRIVLGRGAFVDPDKAGPDKARWRTPAEIEAHAATTPASGHVGTCYWPPAGRAPAGVLDAITKP